FFDACHLLKNVRTSFQVFEIINTPSGPARWENLIKLQLLQEKEGLRAANKLSSRHIFFSNQKMKVKLAVQTLSNSVASALVYCKKTGCAGFRDVDATSKFISIFDKLFDVFNSRSPACKGFKAPISSTNWSQIKTFMNEAKFCLFNLRDVNNQLVVNGRKKMGFIGFLFN
ncbi:hypothetical protein CAPTEDRAFT_46899, partial [Capitella teleta]